MRFFYTIFLYNTEGNGVLHSVCILAYCLMQSACGNLVVFAFYHRLTTGFPGGVQAAPCRPHHPGVVNDLQRTTGFPIRTGRCARHPIRRGRCPHRPVFQCNDHMYVIGHDDIFINVCILMFCIDIVDRGDVGIAHYGGLRGFPSVGSAATATPSVGGDAHIAPFFNAIIIWM